MKKISLITVSLFSLSVIMAVSSFAWFQLKNNGQLGIDVNTQDGLEIFFSQTSTVDEAMMPAKLKKGVVSNESGLIDGEEIVPKGREVLPKVDSDYNYVINGNSFVSQSEYLEYPASIVYNQFELESAFTDLTFTFIVRYFNVDDDPSTDISTLDSFMQTEALTFNFFVMNQKLTNEELDTISTIKDEASSKVTVDKFLSNKATDLDSTFALKNGVNISDSDLTPAEVDSYRLSSTGDNQTGIYTVDVVVEQNVTQYLLIESYYSVPDALIEGNLPLTGKFVLDISYAQKVS